MIECGYCGDPIKGFDVCSDHIVAKSRGGPDRRPNRRASCRTCNSIKGAKSLDEARPFLMQKRLGWPKFNAAQLEWLRVAGFDMSPLDDGKLHFEARPAREISSFQEALAMHRNAQDQ